MYIYTDYKMVFDLCLTFCVFNNHPKCNPQQIRASEGKKMLNFRVFGKPWWGEGSYVSMSHKKWLAIKVPSKLREKTVTCTRQIWSLLCIHWILFHENSNPIANERQCNDINLIMSGPVNAFNILWAFRSFYHWTWLST